MCLRKTLLKGGSIADLNQQKERQHRRFQEQLGFYAALLGMRMEIRVNVALAFQFAQNSLSKQLAQKPL